MELFGYFRQFSSGHPVSQVSARHKRDFIVMLLRLWAITIRVYDVIQLLHSIYDMECESWPKSPWGNHGMVTTKNYVYYIRRYIRWRIVQTPVCLHCLSFPAFYLAGDYFNFIWAIYLLHLLLPWAFLKCHHYFQAKQLRGEIPSTPPRALSSNACALIPPILLCQQSDILDNSCY